ncbi:MAG: SDR family NAD(P)-dependent oxidoreductase [Pyrinomonadaceae bacterium]
MNLANRNNALVWGLAGVGAVLAAKMLLSKSRAIGLADKVVVVTGGSRGLGLVLAREAAKEGAKVAICARDISELKVAKQDLEERGANVFTYPCDVTNKAEVGQFINAVRMEFGQIDVLINNAGVIQVSPVEHLTAKDYQESLKTHFWAAFNTINEVFPDMRRRREGRIVNISSIGGKVPFPHLNSYVVGKFALAGYSEGLRAEVLQDGVYVTTVCPGLIRTGSPRNATFKGQNEKEYAWFKNSDSLPGLSTSAEDCARQIIAATKRGDAELIVTLPAKIGAAVHGLFPGLTADLLSLVNQFVLPAAGSIGEKSALGKQSESAASETSLTALTDAAAERNNEKQSVN